MNNINNINNMNNMNNSKAERVFLKRLFELMICVFYTWYFLPVCNALLPNDRFKLVFFAFFAAGCVGMFLLEGIRLNTVIVAVLSYMIVFALLFAMGLDDAGAHIRISFMFWGTALLYFGILKEDSQYRIGKYLLFLLIVTVITSAIGVITDNSAARVIAHAASDEVLQNSYKMKNISSIYLFQGLVYFVPMMIWLPKNVFQRIAGIVLIAAILFVLVNASFTISLLICIVTLCISITQSGKSINRVMLTGGLGLLAVYLWFNLSDILLFLSTVIDNYKITDKLAELSKLFSGEVLSGDVAERWELYKVSLKTFSQNLLGTGAHYSYVKFENGIGYHSQIIDDLARYGVFALAFYITFFVGYYRCLKDEWKKLECSQIAGIITFVYILFLIFNLGFRSAEESVLMLFVLPVLPGLILQWRKKRAKKTEERCDSV